jgi:hypothetical protein
VTFLRENKQPVAKPLAITESRSGYQQLQAHLEKLHQHHPEAHIHLGTDAAGQYATNLETFLWSLDHLRRTRGQRRCNSLIRSRFQNFSTNRGHRFR